MNASTVAMVYGSFPLNKEFYSNCFDLIRDSHRSTWSICSMIQWFAVKQIINRSLGWSHHCQSNRQRHRFYDSQIIQSTPTWRDLSHQRTVWQDRNGDLILVCTSREVDPVQDAVSRWWSWIRGGHYDPKLEAAPRDSHNLNFIIYHLIAISLDLVYY